MSETASELNAADLTAEADIRAAMADDRYWGRGDPERGAYVQQVSNAWQRLTELVAADESRTSRTGVEPVGAPGPDVPVGRPAVVFVGGAGDSWLHGPVSRGFDDFARANLGADVRYFTHDNAQGVRDHIDSLPAGTQCQSGRP